MSRGKLLIADIRRRDQQRSRQKFHRWDRVYSRKYGYATVLRARYIVSRLAATVEEHWGWCYLLRLDSGYSTQGLVQEHRLRLTKKPAPPRDLP